MKNLLQFWRKKLGIKWWKTIQEVNNLFVLAYAIVDNDDDNVTNENSHRKDFVPRVKIENYNIEIDGRNFYDQPINDSIK